MFFQRSMWFQRRQAWSDLNSDMRGISEEIVSELSQRVVAALSQGMKDEDLAKLTLQAAAEQLGFYDAYPQIHSRTRAIIGGLAEVALFSKDVSSSISRSRLASILAAQVAYQASVVKEALHNR